MPIEDEGHAIDEVVDRLAARFPDLPRDAILGRVQTRLLTFQGAAVRDFVPVLVEHQVMEILAGRIGAPPAGPDSAEHASTA